MDKNNKSARRKLCSLVITLCMLASVFGGISTGVQAEPGVPTVSNLLDGSGAPGLGLGNFENAPHTDPGYQANGTTLRQVFDSIEGQMRWTANDGTWQNSGSVVTNPLEARPGKKKYLSIGAGNKKDLLIGVGFKYYEPSNSR